MLGHTKLYYYTEFNIDSKTGIWKLSGQNNFSTLSINEMSLPVYVETPYILNRELDNTSSIDADQIYRCDSIENTTPDDNMKIAFLFNCTVLSRYNDIIYSQGDTKVGIYKSEISDMYPENGRDLDGYWYVKINPQ